MTNTAWRQSDITRDTIAARLNCCQASKSACCGCVFHAIWNTVMSSSQSCRFIKLVRNNRTGKMFHAQLDCMQWSCPDCSLKLKASWVSHATEIFNSEVSIYRFHVEESRWETAAARLRRRNGDYMRIRSPSGIKIYSNILVDDFGMTLLRDAVSSVAFDVNSIDRTQRPVSTSRGWKLTTGPHRTSRIASAEEIESHRSSSILARKPRSIAPRDRFIIFKRDGYRCQICGRSSADGKTKLYIDHKIPVSKGGQSNLENLWVLCFQCNIGKSTDIL